MSSPEAEVIIADDACLVSPSANEASLLRETNLSFRAWLSGKFKKFEQTPIHDEKVTAKEIAFEGTLRVDAYMAGLVQSEDGQLILAAGGIIDGDIFVREAHVNGTIRGDIHASQRVEFGSSARVIGDIETAQLLIQPGATFQGRCTFTSDETDAREAA
jgi:cytoskeletal protein CcmA (bactofilin family)